VDPLLHAETDPHGNKIRWGGCFKAKLLVRKKCSNGPSSVKGRYKP